MRIGRPRAKLPTDAELLQSERFGLRTAAAPGGLAPQLASLSGMVTLWNPVVVTEPYAVTSTVARPLVVVRGADSRLDADGAQLTIAPSGWVQFHGSTLPGERPDFLVRCSRNAAGDSNNGANIQRLACTGVSRAHLSIESCELTYLAGSIIEQYDPNGAAVSVSNANRSGDPSDRSKATCSGHTWIGNTFANFGIGGDVLDQWCGTAIRAHGLAERVNIYGGWIAGPGDGTALTMTITGVEEWEGGARANWPRHWTLDDVTAEGAYKIRLFNMRDIDVRQSDDMLFNPWKTVVGRYLDGKWRRVLTLRGISAESIEEGGFIVTEGMSEDDLFGGSVKAEPEGPEA